MSPEPCRQRLTFDNGTGFNDYFEGFTFGSTLSFQVSLYGPAFSSPDGTSTSGSTFAFSMFSDPAGTMPALTTDTTDGFAFTVDVNLDGTTTVTNFVGADHRRAGNSCCPGTGHLAADGVGHRLLARVPFPATAAVKRRPDRSLTVLRSQLL